MVPRSEEVGESGLLGEPVDELNEADVPLCRVPSVDHRIAALEHEAHRIGPRLEGADGAEHGLNDESVLVLEVLSVPASPGVAVDDEREADDVGALRFRRKGEAGGLDGNHPLRWRPRAGR